MIDRKTLADRIATAGSVWIVTADEDMPIELASADRLTDEEQQLIIALLYADMSSPKP